MDVKDAARIAWQNEMSEMASRLRWFQSNPRAKELFILGFIHGSSWGYDEATRNACETLGKAAEGT